MQYMMMLNESADDFAAREDPARSAAYWGAWTTFIREMAAAGIVVNGDGLLGPAMSTTLRLRDGAREVQDGPFADVKEQLGGYFVIEVPDLDAALAWAAKAPCAATGSVELRPVMPPMSAPA